MRRLFRHVWDKLFTATATLSVLLMTAALLIILGPMIVRGMGAVFFKGTVEFREMQLQEKMFNRGNPEAVARELQQTNQARKPIYDILSGPFSLAMDPTPLINRTKHLYRQLGTQLRNLEDRGELEPSEARRIKRAAKKVRKAIVYAMESQDNETAKLELEEAFDPEYRDKLSGTVGQQMLPIAEQYREVLNKVDVSRRYDLGESVIKTRENILKLLGPGPGLDAQANLVQERYGATRWDRTQILLNDLLYEERWMPVEGQVQLEKVKVHRAEVFEGTEFAELFRIAERDIDKMMNPEFTVYWQFFIDDSTPGHFVGGVGPEIVGTLLLTLLTIALAVPVGVTTAAYLVECATDNLFVRATRMCINTLAGVPSIVFALFGLAFFVLILQPAIGMGQKPSIFSGALTLGVLVLPIIIRASEEAIRAVPQSYKEASLALGAGKFRTFMTVTLPAALPGVLTGIILSMSRAAGETAPILFVAAVAFRKGIPDSIFEGGTRALSTGSYFIAVGDRIGARVPHNQYGMIMTLVLLVLLMNIAAIILRSRMAKKLRGG